MYFFEHAALSSATHRLDTCFQFLKKNLWLYIQQAQVLYVEQLEQVCLVAKKKKKKMELWIHIVILNVTWNDFILYPPSLLAADLKSIQI